MRSGRHRGVIVSGVLLQFERDGRIIKINDSNVASFANWTGGAVRRALNSMTFRVKIIRMSGNNPEKRKRVNFSRGKICIGPINFYNIIPRNDENGCKYFILSLFNAFHFRLVHFEIHHRSAEFFFLFFFLYVTRLHQRRFWICFDNGIVNTPSRRIFEWNWKKGEGKSLDHFILSSNNFITRLILR